jgi:hypothetical protein
MEAGTLAGFLWIDSDHHERRYIMKRIKLLLLGFVTSLLSGFILFSPSYALAQSGRYSDWHMGPEMMGS